MRYNQVLQVVIVILLLFSCKKDYSTKRGVPPSPAPAKKILLKDITIPHLPSPYYHFEYNADSMVTKADFASGFTIYDILYSGNKIGEMRNNILVNHDTLRYNYDNAGKVTMITFINDDNIIYRHAIFTYSENQVKQIDWEHKEDNAGFITDRTLTFTYYADGNVKTINERRPAIAGAEEYTAVTQFEQYDDKINVDDFSLIHDGIHDHLFLLQGFRLQKNNPRKQTFSGGLIAYTANYTYNYNSDNTPSTMTGTLLFTAGADAGKSFPLSTFYTYY